MTAKFAFVLALLASHAAFAGEVTVAVASNFLTTAEKLRTEFQTATGHDVVLTHGSTGQLYAQIDAGAPFDVFLAADQRRPALLRDAGKARDVRTYALGRLVLVSTEEVTQESASEAFVGKTEALADPTVAPYGLAATAAMEKLKLDTATFRPVLVTNVGQVATVFATGNAEFAFVAASQLPVLNAPHELALSGLHPAITQDAAFLTRAAENDAAEAFWTWLFSDKGQEIIEAAGYDLAE